MRECFYTRVFACGREWLGGGDDSEVASFHVFDAAVVGMVVENVLVVVVLVLVKENVVVENVGYR